MKAVIPAAGFGTRFLPASKSQPKEMMPIISKPTIQYVVEEAIGAGCDDIIIITGRHKRSIENHFDRSPELEALLERRGQEGELAGFFKLLESASLYFTRQPRALGLGDAVLRARGHVNGEPFAVLLGDDITSEQRPVMRQLMEVHKRTGRPVIALEQVPWDKVSRYGVVSPAGEMRDEPGAVFDIDDLVEKPTRESAPSRLAIAGRYILPPELFSHLKETKPGAGGEIQLTDGIRSLNAVLKERGEPFLGVIIEGIRYDTGTVLAWLKTNIRFALKDDDLKDDVREFLARALEADREKL